MKIEVKLDVEKINAIIQKFREGNLESPFTAENLKKLEELGDLKPPAVSAGSSSSSSHAIAPVVTETAIVPFVPRDVTVFKK